MIQHHVGIESFFILLPSSLSLLLFFRWFILDTRFLCISFMYNQIILFLDWSVIFLFNHTASFLMNILFFYIIICLNPLLINPSILCNEGFTLSFMHAYYLDKLQVFSAFSKSIINIKYVNPATRKQSWNQLENGKPVGWNHMSNRWNSGETD